MSRLVRMEFIAELRGEVNGEPIVVDGEGSIVQQFGVTSGTYFLRKLPGDFDPKLLAGCLVTGYPSACPDTSTHKNPFGASPYRYHRRLDLGQAGSLSLEVDCNYEQGRLLSRFFLKGTARAANVGEPRPIVETWDRTSQRDIDGLFSMEWSLGDRPTVTVVATTTYSIARPIDIPSRLTREIDVCPKRLEDDVFSLFQISSIS